MQRRHIMFAIQTIGSVVLLTVLFRSLDWEKSSEVLRHISPTFYIVSLLAVFAGQMLVTFRWQVMLKVVGVDVPFGEVFRQGLIGQFFSSLMPTAVGGDAAKVYYLGRRAGFAEVGASVFLDRFLGFLWLATLGALLAWATGADSELLVLNRNLLTLFAVGLWALALATALPVERVLAVVVPARWDKVRSKLFEFSQSVRLGALDPRVLIVSLLVGLAFSSMLGEIYREYFRANGLGDLPFWRVILVLMSMSIFANVPLSVNGIGLREQLHVLLFASLGVPPEVAVWISLLFFTHTLLVASSRATFSGCGSSPRWLPKPHERLVIRARDLKKVYRLYGGPVYRFLDIFGMFGTATARSPNMRRWRVSTSRFQGREGGVHRPQRRREEHPAETRDQSDRPSQAH